MHKTLFISHNKIRTISGQGAQSPSHASLLMGGVPLSTPQPSSAPYIQVLATPVVLVI